MEYLVDGYNVIKFSDMFSAGSLETSRNKLIDFILKYNPQGKNSITVVFDCKSQNPFEFNGYTTTTIKGIKTIFSEGQKSADDVIVDYVENSSKPYNIVVVTNDKGIFRRIGGGVKKMSVSEFLYDRAKQQNQVRTIIKTRSKDDFSAISRELSDLWLKNDKKENSKKIKNKKSESEFDITAELSDLWLKK
ncbi:NYN domain-containing protein [Candidatus Ruminimicrobium bovinum]|uniref:NYN domain-containing protein n=1 Tax=Candidatus Ruminimicrobium bovinum TaxID=3242779 RepID=UPI0039B8D598